MELKEYLYSKNRTIKSFAEEIGYTRESISLVIRKITNPGPRMIYRIEQATDRAVTKEDLLRRPDLNLQNINIAQ